MLLCCCHLEKLYFLLNSINITLCWLTVWNISDGFVPIGKEEYEKKHDANADLLEKAIDEVVAKQLDLGTIYKIRLQKIRFFDTQDPYNWKMGDFQPKCENLLYVFDWYVWDLKCIKYFFKIKWIKLIKWNL